MCNGHVRVHMHTFGAEDNLLELGLSFHHWVLGIKLKSSGLGAGSFSDRAISSDINLN